MARQILDIGGNANDGTGDTLRAAMDKINDNFVELYDVSVDNFITITQNNITATRSNDNINLIPAGTGTVAIANLTIDNNINLTDNNISVTQTNSDLVVRSSGTGSIVVDTISIRDNTISTNASNADLQLNGSGTGTVVLNSLRFPSSDGTGNQVLITDGSGNLGWATVATGSFTHITNTDGTASLTGSSAGVVDSFPAGTYRSAKYSVSMWDSTNSRAGIQDFYVTHDGSSAYITATGITSTGTDMATFTADIDSGNVRVLATLASSDGTVFKFNKILINV
jgi:hypothetical protein